MNKFEKKLEDGRWLIHDGLAGIDFVVSPNTEQAADERTVAMNKRNKEVDDFFN